MRRRRSVAWRTGGVLLVSAAGTGTGHAASLSGVVLDAHGDPVAGAVVTAYDPALATTTARTDADGAWRMSGLGAGRHRLRATPAMTDPRVDSFLPDAWEVCASEPVDVEDADVDGLDFVLPIGATLTGRLLDREGQPVAGAIVATSGRSERTSRIVRRATSATDGTFVLVGLDGDPGRDEPWAVGVRAAGRPDQYLGGSYRVSEAEDIAVPGGGARDLGDWVLHDGIALSGIVTGDGLPLTEGKVYAYSTSQVREGLVDDDGGWSIVGLPPGEVLAWAEVPGRATTYTPGTDRPTSERIAAPDEGMHVDGVALELPAEHALDLRLEAEGARDRVSVLLLNTDGTVGRGGGVDADGHLRIGGLWPGRYRLSVSGAAGGLVSDVLRDADGAEALVEVDGETPLVLRWPRESALSGTVVDEDGMPVHGAEVAWRDSTRDITTPTVTARDGTWRIGGRPAGEGTLAVRHRPLCPDDAGYTATWWPDARVAEDAATRILAPETSEEGVRLVVARDEDHDGMGDAWEAAHGLDPGADDSGDDPDGDGIPNLDEWRADTAPDAPDRGVPCGCGGGSGAALGLLPWFWRRRRAERVVARGRCGGRAQPPAPALPGEGERNRRGP
jgi:hypothetical protein